jgi:hypothetical protein
MCVLQCQCGMVVSTRERQTRCIRCGTILGPCERLELKVEQSRGECEARNDGEVSDRETCDADARGDRRHAALAAYVTVVILAAARTLWERTEVV